MPVGCCEGICKFKRRKLGRFRCVSNDKLPKTQIQMDYEQKNNLVVLDGYREIDADLKKKSEAIAADATLKILNPMQWGEIGRPSAVTQLVPISDDRATIAHDNLHQVNDINPTKEQIETESPEEIAQDITKDVLENIGKLGRVKKRSIIAQNSAL